MQLEVEEDDEDGEIGVSGTWLIDNITGTMRHKATGLKVSTTTGVTFDNQEYRLSPQDLELDMDAHLGAGACGVVLRGTIKTTGLPVAVKTVRVDDKGKREQLLNEIRGLVTGDGCPNLVQFYGGFVAKGGSAVHVVLEFMDLGSLADLKKRLQGSGVPYQYMPCIAQQIMLGLNYLHEKRLLHRDIKPENILHNRAGEVKLTDFGITKSLDTTLAMANTFNGTITYMAPERCLGEAYSLASDIWSVGLVLVELATGHYPFVDVSTFPKLFEHVCVKPEPRLDPGLYPPAMCDFVARCLTRDVALRSDTPTLVQHEFVTRDVGTVAAFAEFLNPIT